MTHATVKTRGYEVPLIGVPKDATQETCDDCGKSFHIQKIELCGAAFLCAFCKVEPVSPLTCDFNDYEWTVRRLKAKGYAITSISPMWGKGEYVLQFYKLPIPAKPS